MKTPHKKPLQLVLALATLVLGDSIIHSAQAASWVTTGSLDTPRYTHTATLLPGGNVLVAGGKSSPGINASGVTNSVELYNPSTGNWTPAAPLNIARSGHTATLLPNGKVLVTGGSSASGVTNSVELYDPSAGTWTLIASMTTNRGVHTATLLPNGKVLVAGGFYGIPLAGPLDSAELYDPAAGTWTRTGPMSTPRGYHKAALLPSGQVLLAGGSDSAFNPFSSADLFTPATGQWTPTGSMKSPRAGFAALLLPNGKVLATGGFADTPALASAELYDPATGTWTWTTSMANARADNTATLLPNGSALLVDGWGNTGDTPTSELYNPTTETWSAAAPFNSPRFWITATLLPNGNVLATGGKNSDQIIFSTAQLYDSGSGPIAPPNLTGTKPLANGSIQLSVSGRLCSVFSVIATADLLNTWAVIGVATEMSPGQFQFTDSQAANNLQRFYRVRSP